MLTKFITAPYKLLSPLKKMGFRLLFALGVGIAFLFIAVSLLLDKQAIAVFLAAIGAGLGALIVSLALPKLLLNADSARQKQLELEMQAALKEKSKLTAELARVKAQQLQLQQISAVMKLTLLEVDMNLTDFKQQDLGVREKTLGGKTSTQYVGVMRKRAKMMLGLDLSKVRVVQMGKELLVSDLKAYCHGISESSDEWLFRQLQVQEDNVLWPNRINVQLDSQALMQAADEHRDELNVRLQNGVETQSFDQAIAKMGEQWLKVMFAPIGLEVKKVNGLDDKAMFLLDYLKQQELTAHHALNLLENSQLEQAT